MDHLSTSSKVSRERLHQGNFSSKVSSAKGTFSKGKLAKEVSSKFLPDQETSNSKVNSTKETFNRVSQGMETFSKETFNNRNSLAQEETSSKVQETLNKVIPDKGHFSKVRMD